MKNRICCQRLPNDFIVVPASLSVTLEDPNKANGRYRHNVRGQAADRCPQSTILRRDGRKVKLAGLPLRDQKHGNPYGTCLLCCPDCSDLTVFVLNAELPGCSSCAKVQLSGILQPGDSFQVELIPCAMDPDSEYFNVEKAILTVSRSKDGTWTINMVDYFDRHKILFNPDPASIELASLTDWSQSA